jgi:hypothetical protein
MPEKNAINAAEIYTLQRYSLRILPAPAQCRAAAGDARGNIIKVI